jgi:hypothetical protein
LSVLRPSGLGRSAKRRRGSKVSGGSFNYMYRKELHELIYMSEDVKDMADELEALGFHKAAQDTLEFHKEASTVLQALEKKRDQLADVWYAVEWWRSSDTSRESAEKAAREYEEKFIDKRSDKDGEF